MITKNAVVTTAAVGTVAYTVIEFLKFRKDQKETRRRVAAKERALTAEERAHGAAVIYAWTLMHMRIKDGLYNNATDQQVKDDYEFAKIEYRTLIEK